ncbi:macrophage mannose receptor 1-like [Battus philenor]|uniref:macrophage mannose receptor 1-like n=1 Tax=Battus philenor TaxID=42288 RepID=UPI0035CFF5AF
MHVLLRNMLRFKCALTLFLLFIVSQAHCQSNFFRDDYHYIENLNSFYKIHTIQKTWKEAMERCDLEGAFLFYPETHEEVDLVTRYWNETQPFDIIYIGISDLAAKEVYTTVDGVPIKHVYNYWAPGQPDNREGDENCLVLTRDGTLKDEQCLKKYPFICKKTKGSVKWNEECQVPDPAYVYNNEVGRCYKFHDTPLNWKDAALVCDIEQSYLAIINSETEAKYLANITKNAFNDIVITPDSCNTVALGINYSDSKGWLTIQGEKVEESGYNQWAGKQPHGTEKLCGSMNHNGLLTDIHCESKCYFICEHENLQLSFFDDRNGS